MDSKVILERVEEIKKIPSFCAEKGIKKIILLVNQNYKLEEIGEVNKLNRAYAIYYITIIKFYCVSHETQGGNRYIKENFHIVVQNSNEEEDIISCNGWRINDLETYGDSFGYPNKLDIKFRLMDIFGSMTEEIKKRFYGTYDEAIVQQIVHMVELLKTYSEYHSIKNYLLLKKIEELEKELQTIKLSNNKKTSIGTKKTVKVKK